MEMDDFLGVHETGSCTPEAIAKATAILKVFNQKNAQAFTFCDRGYPLPIKEQFIDALLLHLKPGHKRQWADADYEGQAMTCLRILSRERKGIQKLHTKESIQMFMMHAGLETEKNETENGEKGGEGGTAGEATGNTDGKKPGNVERLLPSGGLALTRSVLAQEESVKCLINAVYDNKPILDIFVQENGAISLVKRVGKLLETENVTFELLNFQLRLLFMVTAMSKDAVEQILDAGGVKDLAGMLERLIPADTKWPQPEDTQSLVSELYKIAFSVTCKWSRFSNSTYDVSEEDLEVFGRLVVTVRHVLLGYSSAGLPMDAPLVTHAVNLLFNTPATGEKYLIPVNNRGKKEWAVIVAILKYMDTCAKDSQDSDKLRGQLSAILTALRSFARNDRDLRQYMFEKILPKRADYSRRPEQENSYRGHLVSLMTSHLSYVKDIVADFLFVLCKENMARLIKHTGYGNAAGLLAQRGIFGVPHDKSNAPGYSTDSGVSTDEEKEKEVNPVTGTYFPEGPHPISQMTEEEREAEAERLGLLFEKINKSGIIKVMSVDDKHGNMTQFQGPD
eukprot:comp19694_c0_seq1/m.23395 comp19694_c0_seq1/g.23395  ORF comp19694_c0_seq1/g.23395 comp19694_c0_seq1/m.23395 type:complete len:564 (-) comp19694_c0_seq1:679-2370(-)